ncbi:MAG TPA: DUF4234 domain-containing protein, partial [Firmicutes bacterium]|nr:DUF4234 domain-containing protein [Bacillota bacterium]
MRQRSIPVCIILSIVTCGIYGIYWYIMLTEDSNVLVARPGYASGGVAFLLSLVTCNIYGIYWAYKMGEKIDIAKQMRGWPSSNSGVLYLILELVFPIIGWALMQNEINNLIATMQP